MFFVLLGAAMFSDESKACRAMAYETTKTLLEKVRSVFSYHPFAWLNTSALLCWDCFPSHAMMPVMKPYLSCYFLHGMANNFVDISALLCWDCYPLHAMMPVMKPYFLHVWLTILVCLQIDFESRDKLFNLVMEWAENDSVSLIDNLSDGALLVSC
jgi:hypothetical protein